MDDAARAEFGDDERKERPEEQVMDLEEVAGPDVAGMVAQEGSPRLPTRPGWTCLAHVALNGPLRDLDPNLQQLTTDAFGTPQPVIDRHLLD